MWHHVTVFFGKQDKRADEHRADLRHHIKYLELLDPATTALSLVAVIFLMNAKILKKAGWAGVSHKDWLDACSCPQSSRKNVPILKSFYRWGQINGCGGLIDWPCDLTAGQIPEVHWGLQRISSSDQRTSMPQMRSRHLEASGMLDDLKPTYWYWIWISMDIMHSASQWTVDMDH